MRAMATNPAHVGRLAGSLAREATLHGALYAVLVGAAGVYLVAFVLVALFRLSFPFPLEITEGAALREVQRILTGQPLYVAPTLEHVPLIYGPVYFYLSALTASITGLSYLPLRLVSLIASLGSLALIARWVHLETDSRTAGVIAAGLLAAAYPLAQTTLDLGRVDALFVFFLLAGVYLAYAETRRGLPARWPILSASGIMIGVAGLTKIPVAAAPVAVALTVYLIPTVRARRVAFVIGFVATIVVGLLLLRLQSGPWPTWYLWDLPRLHEVRQNFLDRFWFTDMLPRFTLPFLLGPIFVLGRYLRDDRRLVLFYAVLALSLVGLAWASRSNGGGSINVLLPAHVLVALLLGLGLHEVLRQIGDASLRARAFRCYVLGVCLVQFALIAYNPRLLVPYRSDQWADERLATRLAALPGEIFAPDLEGFLRTSDKGEQPHLGAVEELIGGYGGIATDEGVRWKASLVEALRQRRFQYVVLSETDCCLKGLVLDNGYVDAGPLFPPDDEFWLLKTTHTPDEHLYAAPTG